jgi:hypothetical protein
MDARRLFRSSLPLVLLIAFSAVSPGFQGSSFALIPSEETMGDYSFQELSHLLPEGVVDIQVAAPWGNGAFIVGSRPSGDSLIVRYEPSKPKISEPLAELPPYYLGVTKVARSGSRYLIAGQSVGTSAVMGFYDASTSNFTDHTFLLPEETVTVSLLASAGSDFLVVLKNESAYAPWIFNPGSRSLSMLNAEGFQGMSDVRHATWNGSAIFIGGRWVGGDPALVILNPSNGSLEDLSSLLPGDMHRIDYLIWADDVLYILGIRYWLWTTRVSLAVYDPSSGSINSLTDADWNDYSRVQMGLWNGTSLLLLVWKNTWRSIAVYHPENDTALFLDNSIPGYWSYAAMIPSGVNLLLVGNYIGPSMGFLEIDTWEWEETEGAFEGPYRSVYSATAADDLFVIVGGRTSTAALGLLDPAANVLDDRSDDLDIQDAVLLGAGWAGDRVLLTGVNESQGLLYTYDMTTRTVTNFSESLPREVDFLLEPAWNGGVYLIPGYEDGKVALIVFDPGDNSTKDLSHLARPYFRFVTKVVPYEDGFLILGTNDLGAAMATLDTSTERVEYLGNDLGEFYGPFSFLAGAAWDGKSFLIVGLANDGPLMGIWSPAEDTYDDLSSLLPEEFQYLSRVLWTGEEFIVGGAGGTSAALGAYYPSNKTFQDLTDILPPSYAEVGSMAWLEGEVLIVARTDSWEVAMGMLTIQRTAVGPFEGLPTFLKDPSNALILGLSVGLVAILAFLAGRRGRKPASVAPPPEEPYQSPPYEVPEIYQEQRMDYRDRGHRI